MKDELTTSMHEELLGDEIPHDDLMCMAVYGAMKRGVTKTDALKSYGISEEFYDANIERVMHCPDY